MNVAEILKAVPWGLNHYKRSDMSFGKGMGHVHCEMYTDV